MQKVRSFLGKIVVLYLYCASEMCESDKSYEVTFASIPH